MSSQNQPQTPLPDHKSAGGGVFVSLYAGLFLLAFSVMLFEILLSRIFSVTMWYHFAFMAISVAMFGLSSGALAVYLKAHDYPQDATLSKLSINCLLFSGAAGVSVLIHAAAQLLFKQIPMQTACLLYALASYPLIAVAFHFSGVAICLALTRFPAKTGKLYAIDLFGSALACLLVIAVLEFTDAFGGVLLAATAAATAACLFAAGAKSQKLIRVCLSCLVCLALTAAAQTFTAASGKPLFSLRFAKGQLEPQLLFEKWNCFSRLSFLGTPDLATEPFCWGLSKSYPKNKMIKQLLLQIDSGAGTVITNLPKEQAKSSEFNTESPQTHAFADPSSLEELGHLRADISNLAHYLRSDADVFVIGVGGGRDILSALVFKQKSVTGVEINKDIIKTLTGKFGDYSGHLERFNGVKLINDEARSYLSRSRMKFDIIQVSLIDTWAASGAGGLALTENSLYTVEAWQEFLIHLNRQGILSCSRWYESPEPRELYRLLSLARESLLKLGVKNPRDHVAVLVNFPEKSNKVYAPVLSMLVSPQPFNADDLQTLEIVSSLLQFDIVLSPNYCRDQRLSELLSGKDLNLTPELPLNLSAASDDCPYFFQFMNVSALFDAIRSGKLFFDRKFFNACLEQGNALASTTALLILVLILNSICLIFPLLKQNPKPSASTYALLAYFILIGSAFMFIEIAQMQRLSLYLGHPSYSLTVVLFSLLVSCAAGSYSTKAILFSDIVKDGYFRLGLLLLLTAASGLGGSFILTSFQNSETEIRIIISGLLSSAMGFFMGMALPIGLRLAGTQALTLGPWLWGLNGAASVTASVLSVLIALVFGIRAAFLTGVFCYLGALIAFMFASKNEQA